MATLSIYHDTRRKLDNSTYPVKIRVYCSKLKKTKFYKTGLSYSVKDFSSIWHSQKVRKEFKKERARLDSIKTHSREVLEKIQIFSFEEFEKRTFRNKGDSVDAFYHYSERIKKLRKNAQISTAETYSLSLKSFRNYLTYLKLSDSKLSFFEITSDWLKAYQKHMIETGRSRNTVSIYTRTLRTIFNEAIQSNDIDRAYYPFGKGKYIPPSSKKVKKALNLLQLKTLFNAEPKTPEQEKAKDFWFFTFAANGLNVKDIALLTHDRLSEDSFHFYRAKTLELSEESEPIIVHLNKFTKGIINKYKTSRDSKLVFPILHGNEDAEEQHKKIKKFTRFINQHINKLAEAHKLPHISTYWARHSFAAKAIRGGKSMEFVGDTFGHSNYETTKAYFQGFEDDVKKEFSQQIMDFD